MIARILPPFSNEPALVGELVSVPNFIPGHTTGEVEAKLLGDSKYIRNNTDGYVIVNYNEIAKVGY